MFRTSYVHHQEDCIVHTALYGMLFMHLCKQSVRLKDVLDTNVLVYLMSDCACTSALCKCTSRF